MKEDEVVKLPKKLGAIFDAASSRLFVLAGVMLASVTGLVTIDVILRYFLRRPIGWSLEITEYALLWITFLGAAWVLKREGHVKMDLVLTRFNPRNQRRLNFITSAIGAITCLIFTWYGVTVTWDSFQMGLIMPTALRPHRGYILAVIPVGSFLLFIQFLRRTHGYLRGGGVLPDKEQNPP